MSKRNLELYTDNHPETSIKGLGFKDVDTVQKTIKVISKRSINYQKSVIITMYYRAKYYPTQTLEMKKSDDNYEEMVKR